MNLLILVMGVVTVGLGLVLAPDSGGAGLMISAVGFIMVMMGYGMYRSQVIRMPFRMYERGFTQTSVTFSQGRKRQEVLILYEMLEKVSIEASSFQGISLNNMKVTYLGSSGSDEMVLSFEAPDNPLDVMLAFQRIAPSRVDPSLHPYVGPGAEDAAIPVPFEDRKGSTTHDASGIVMSTGMMFFIALLTGMMMGGFDMHPLGFVIAATIQGIMYIVFLGMATMLALRGFKSSVGDSVQVAGDELVLPRSALYLLYADTRRRLPMTEVREVRKAVDSTFFGHKALLVTSDGEKVVTRHIVFQVLSDHPSFVREGFVLRNRRPFTGRGRPMVVANRWKAVLIGLSLLLFSIVIGLTVGGGGDAFFDAWDVYSPYLIMFMLGVMVPIVIILRIMLAKRAARGDGVMSSDMGLMMPGKDGAPHWISKGEVRSAEVKKDLLGPYIELTTAGGIERLPLSVAQKLDEAGIRVEDDMGLIQAIPRSTTPDMVPPPVPGMTGPPPMGPPAGVAGPMSAGPPVHGPRVSGRGMLLSEMSAQKVESERQKAHLLGMATLAGSILFGAFLFVLGPEFMGDTICTLFVGIIVVALGGLGVILLVASRRMGPVRVYENGVEWVSIAKGPHFVGWGDFTKAKETEFGGTRSLTLTRYNRPAGSISSDLPGYSEWVPMIMERVNDPAYASGPVVERESATKYWAIQMTLFAISFVLGIATAVYAGSDIAEEMTVTGWQLLLLIGAPTGLGFYFVLTFWMMKRDVFGAAKAKFPTAALMVPVVVILLVFFVTLGAAGPVSLKYSVDIVESEDPGHTALDAGEYMDMNITVDGPVTVGAGETLMLYNTTLTFDPAPGLDYGIWVHPEGTLIMDHAWIGSVDPDVGFTFEIHGDAVILDSEIVGTASDPVNYNGEGGLELYCSDIRVENTTFRGARSAALMTVYCSPIIRGCTFIGAQDEGIEGHGGAPVIEDCTFIDCEWPIILWNGSEGDIVDCTFQDCPRGIDLSQSQATVRNCTFRNITDYCVQWTSDTDPEPVLEGNTYENVGSISKVQSAFTGMGTICTTVTIITAVVGSALLLHMNRKRPDRVPLEHIPDQF